MCHTVYPPSRREALPESSEETRVLASDLVMTTLCSVGKHFSEKPRTPAEVEIYDNAVADMFCAYLKDCGHGSDKRR
ncbi:MAG: hypothetical protein LBB60_01850 [Desulfovibrio sp.]|nr:hypothetical protein [Desulfovibrio sp.]